MKTLTRAIALGGMMMLSGCGGEDTTPLPRVHTLTMINATENSIVSSLFGTQVHTIASKASQDDTYDEFGEAPTISYDGKGEKTIPRGEYFNAYIATPCNTAQYLHHSGQKRELHIVNTGAASVTVELNDGNNVVQTTVGACDIVKSSVTLGNAMKAYLGNQVIDLADNEDRVHDLVIFSDGTMKKFEIKSINL